MRHHVFIVCLTVSCTSSPPSPSSAGPLQETQQTEQSSRQPNVWLGTRECGPWQLHWMGEPPGDTFPPRLGTHELHIEHEDGRQRRFKPTGKLYFSDWNYEPCSPNGAWVALLQDRYGPIHVVASEHLWAYLNGASGHQVVSGNSGKIAHVHSGLEWLDARTLRYAIGGSPAIHFTHDATRPNQPDRRVDGSKPGTTLQPAP